MTAPERMAWMRKLLPWAMIGLRGGAMTATEVVEGSQRILVEPRHGIRLLPPGP